MNQTEIPNILGNNENNNTLNRDSPTTRHNAISVKTGTSHNKVNNTPTESHEQNNVIVSQSKLVRISSSKGIRVMSRQSSTEKQTPSQFKIRSSETQIAENKSLRCPESQTSIKLDNKNINQSHRSINRNIEVMTLPEYLQQKMKKQLVEASQKYQSKINQELSLQYNTLNIELESLKEVIKINQRNLSIKQNQMLLLQEKVEKVESSLLKNLIKVQNKVDGLVGYYQQCNQYTLKRISQIQIKISSIFQEISLEFDPMEKVKTWQKLEKGYTQIKRIAFNLGASTSAFKISTDDDLFELQKTLGSAVQKLQQLQCEKLQMQNIDFGNQGFQNSIEQLKSLFNRQFLSLHTSNEDSGSLSAIFQPKIKQLSKKINSLAIQTELTKNLCQNFQQNQCDIQKIEHLQNQLTTMKNNELKLIKDYEQKMQEIKETMIVGQDYQKKLEVINNLQHILKQKQGTEINLREQIKNLNKKISYYEIKIQRSSDLQINLQTSLAQAYSESLLKQRVKLAEDAKNIQISNLQKINSDNQQKLQKLDRQNYLLAQKLSDGQESTKYKIQTKKLEFQLNFQQQTNKKTQLQYQYCRQENTKLKLQLSQLKIQNSSLKSEIEQYVQEIQKKISNVQQINKDKLAEEAESRKKISELQSENQQLKKKAYQLLALSENKTHQNQQEENSEDNIIDKYSKQQLLEHIQILEQELEIFEEKNNQLNSQNQRLESNLHDYAQTFEKQSLTFRAAIQSLQEEKNLLLAEIRSLQDANNYLKSEFNEYKSSTMQYFYEQKATNDLPNLSSQLKRTCSTQLSSEVHNNKYYDSQIEFKKSNSNVVLSPTKKFRKKEESTIQSTQKYQNRNQQLGVSKHKKKTDKVNHLKNQFFSMGYQMPVNCEIDSTGNLKCERTGIYFIDQNDNLFQLSQKELQSAVSLGIILL